MKKLVLFIIMTVFAFSVFAQTDIVEGDSLIIYGGGNFEAEVQGVEATDLNSFPILQQLNDTVAKYTFVQPVDSITFNPNIPDPSVSSALYTIKSDTLTKLFAIRFGDPFSGITYMNTTINIPFVNTTGDTITKGMPLSGKSLDFSKGRGLPDANITNCTDIGLAQTFAGLAKTDVLPGAVGQIVKFNFLVGINTAAWSTGDILYVDCDSTITNVLPAPPNYKIIVGRVILVGVNGIIEVIAQPFTGSDTDINLQGIINGIITQKQAIRDTVIGGTIYFETFNEENPTTDLPFMANKTIYLLNTLSNTGTNGYARIALVPGTATQSQTNYVYIDNTGTPELAVSTTQFPADGIEVAEINVFDVATHQTYGFGSIQRFNNAVNGSEADGWISKSAKRHREDGAKYQSGSNGTFELIASAGLDSLKYSVSPGEAWQFNLQTINSTGREKYLWLNSPTGELWIDDLHDIDVDANGVTMRSNNTVYGLNLFYVINSGDFDGYFVVNAPNGSYNNDDAAAIQDDNSFAITTVQTKYDKVAFRHARIVVRYTTTSGGTFVNPIGVGEFQNERGQPLGSGGVGGGIGEPQTEFSDADFAILDNIDNTKEMQFEASSITTGTTRILTIPDADGVIALGSGSSTDNAIPRFDGTGGFQLQNSGVIIDDSDNISSVNTMVFDAITAPSHVAGAIFYDVDDDELSFYDSQTDSKLNIGSEIRIKIRNISGSPIPDFTPVYQTGAVGNRAAVDLARANSVFTSRVIAVTTNLVGDNTNAAATTGGTINGVDTDGSPYGEVWVAKDEIFLSAATAGWLTNVAPTGDNIVTSIGYVLTASNTGSFEVKINGANVRGAASSIDNNLVRWDGITGRRIQEGNASLDDSGNLTAANLSGTNTGDQVSGDFNHSGLNELDYASAGHTGFAGTGVENTFTENQTISGDLYADSVSVTNGVTIGGDLDVAGLTSSDSILIQNLTNPFLTLENIDGTLDTDQQWAGINFKENDGSQTVGIVAKILTVAKAPNINFGNLLFQTRSTAATSFNDALLLESDGNAVFDGSITIGTQAVAGNEVPDLDQVNALIAAGTLTLDDVTTNGNTTTNSGHFGDSVSLESLDPFLILENSDPTLGVDQQWAKIEFIENDISQTTGIAAVISVIAKASNLNFGNLLFQTRSKPDDSFNNTLLLESDGNAVFDGDITTTGDLDVGVVTLTSGSLGGEAMDRTDIEAAIAASSGLWTDGTGEVYTTGAENVIVGDGVSVTDKILELRRGTEPSVVTRWRFRNNSSDNKLYIEHNENNFTWDQPFTIGVNDQVSLLTGTGITEFSIDGTLAGNSDDAVPTEKAVKTYVDGVVSVFSGAKGYHSSTQAITSTPSTLAFNSESYDTDTYHDNSTNNSRFTVPSTGYYQVTISGRFVADATAPSNYLIDISKNGGSLRQLNHLLGTGDYTSYSINVTETFSLTSGDYIEVDLSTTEDVTLGSGTSVGITVAITKL
ncbi:hypothetical protein KAR91_00220 [Candidatus Pacearchaeota archaeon]|nr:hypothetical protein [Candidatus Pacearchaeota archaeon]